ncbi:MAG: D-xylose transport system substrate-binding protein [Acidobacteriota bacterium]|jgi:D-xylose transport system substrate-binding protein|nr:D-xylose transport system substrate-binding protein [Acidobacteriota bacterium]
MRASKILTAAALLAALVMSACVSGSSPGTNSNSTGGSYTPKKKGANERVKIGFSMDTLKEERWQRDHELVEKHAKELGADILIDVANGDDRVQINQAENMLTQGVDVLIVAPHNGVAAAAIVEAAHRQGVPVISYDRLIKNADVDLYVASQVVKIGEMQAQYLLDRVGKKPANFVIVGGSPTDNNALLLHQGQMNVLKPAVDRGDVKIIKDDYAKEWQAEEALKIVENALTQSNNKVDAVVASNDGTARGAISALENQGLAGKVLVSGQDADLASLKLILLGKQTMTVYKPIKPLADAAVDAAMKLAHGEAVATHDKVNNGKLDVPSILLDLVAVDKNNITTTIVKDGYQSLERICEGIPADKCPK